MHKNKLVYLVFVLCFFMLIDQVYAIDIKPTGIKVVNGSGGSTYSRKVATSIGIYSKNGVVPGVRKYSGTYAGINYNVLEVDVTDTNGTFIQVDYAGYNSSDYLPKNLNNFYDTDLTRDDAYYWVGSINAGFFTATTTANDYGYPTGAVKKNGNWLKFSPKDGSYTWDTTPSYGTGFVTAYFNKNNEFELIYNGWKDGLFYKYINDPSPNSWDYGQHVNYSEGVSGAYTLIVDGDNTVHWGKDDYIYVDYWNYIGTAVTLFGQKENGNYILLTTVGGMNATNQVGLMTELGCVNAIRFDGGGSTQMTYDEGLILDHFYISKENTEIVEGSSLDVSDIGFDLYMEDGTYYYATSSDIPQAEYQVFTEDGQLVEDVSKASVGDYWLKVLMNGLEQQIAIKVVAKEIDEYTVTFDYNDGKTENLKIVVAEGSKVSKPEDPNKVGYNFIEWQYDGVAYNFDNPINSDITLKAKYEIIVPDIEETSGYKLDGNYLNLPLNIMSNNLTLGLDSIYKIKVYNAKNEEKEASLIATSDKVQILLDDVIVSEYIVTIKGDITGDGKISVVDVGKLYQYFRGKITMEECFIKAGNIIDDNQIKITDVGKLYQFVKGKISSLEG